MKETTPPEDAPVEMPPEEPEFAPTVMPTEEPMEPPMEPPIAVDPPMEEPDCLIAEPIKNDCAEEMAAFFPEVEWCRSEETFDCQTGDQVTCFVDAKAGGVVFQGDCDEMEQKARKEFPEAAAAIDAAYAPIPEEPLPEMPDFDDCMKTLEADTCVDEANNRVGAEVEIISCDYYVIHNTCEDPNAEPECWADVEIPQQMFHEPCDVMEFVIRDYLAEQAAEMDFDDYFGDYGYLDGACEPLQDTYDCTAEMQMFLPEVTWCWHDQGFEGCETEGEPEELWCYMQVHADDEVVFDGVCEDAEQVVMDYFEITDEMIEEWEEDLENEDDDEDDDDFVDEEWCDMECIIHDEGDCTEEARERAGPENDVEVCKYHNGWDHCAEMMVYDECNVIVNGKHYEGPCATIEDQIRADEKEEGCPKEEAGDCLEYLREEVGVGKWVKECWYSREIEACTGEQNWCNAAVLTANGHWIDGSCEEVQAHVEQVQANKRERRQARKAAERAEKAAAEKDTEGTVVL